MHMSINFELKICTSRILLLKDLRFDLGFAFIRIEICRE